jgi:hypothetical protein
MTATNADIQEALSYSHHVEEQPGGALDPVCRKLYTMHPFPFEDWISTLK